MIFLNLCLISVGLLFVTCAPTPKPEFFYDAIVKKCPLVKNDSAYKKNEILDICKDWPSISEVTKLNEKNQQEIRCLLYFETFTEYCEKAQKVDTEVPQAVLGQYTIESICNYAKNISNKNLNVIFTNETNCKKVCSFMGYPHPVCSISAYFAAKKVDLGPSEHTQTQTNTKSDSKTEPEHFDLSQSLPHPESEQQQQPQATQSKQNNKPTEKHSANLQVGQPDSGINTDLRPGYIDPALPSGNGAQNSENVPPPVVPQVDTLNKDLKSSSKQTLNPGNTAEDTPNIDPKSSSKQILKPGNTAEDKRLVEKKVLAPAAETVRGNEKKSESTSVRGNEVNNSNLKPQEAVKSPLEEETENQTGQEGEKTNQEIPKLSETPSKDLGYQETDNNDFAVEGEDDDVEPPQSPQNQQEKDSKPAQTDDSAPDPVNYNTEMEGDSYFFTYFMLLCLIFIVGYVCYHNKQKVLALILEGRRGKRQNRGRRPNSANYHKLDSNLEEAITSSCNTKNTNNVIY